SQDHEQENRPGRSPDAKEQVAEGNARSERGHSPLSILRSPAFAPLLLSEQLVVVLLLIEFFLFLALAAALGAPAGLFPVILVLIAGVVIGLPPAPTRHGG